MVHVPFGGQRPDGCHELRRFGQRQRRQAIDCLRIHRERSCPVPCRAWRGISIHDWFGASIGVTSGAVAESMYGGRLYVLSSNIVGFLSGSPSGWPCRSIRHWVRRDTDDGEHQLGGPPACSNDCRRRAVRLFFPAGRVALSVRQPQRSPCVQSVAYSYYQGNNNNMISWSVPPSLTALLVASLTACGGSGSSSSGTGSGQPWPRVINLYPAGAASGNRLYVMVTAIGSKAVSMPLIFDTGSAGITLYAPAIFPSSMVSSSGFVFPTGEASISYSGITVTNQQGTRAYGDTNGRTQIGNIGYATVSFGDSSGTLTTSVMPVFLYYSIVHSVTGQPVSSVPQQGIFGVNSVTNLITVAGSSEPAAGYPACSQPSAGTCRVVSVLKYVRYPHGINAGFMLSPASLQSCDISSSSSCTPQPMLTVGLTAAQEAGFSTVDLTCPPPTSSYVGPPTMDGYPVCLAAIPGTMVSVSGLATGMLTGEVVFDSGTPFMELQVPAGVSFPAAVPDGTDVLVTTPSGFTYSYTAEPGITQTVVDLNLTGASVIGVGYFTTHSLFVDFATSTAGWK